MEVQLNVTFDITRTVCLQYSEGHVWGWLMALNAPNKAVGCNVYDSRSGIATIKNCCGTLV